MRFLDQFGRSAQQAIDRARFEADKFQKTTALQGEIADLQHKLNQKLIALGERAYDLYRTGTLAPASVADLAREVDALRLDVTRKEDELRQAQAMVYVEPPPDATAQAIPIDDDDSPPVPANVPAAPPAAPPPAPAPQRKTGTAPLGGSPPVAPPPAAGTSTRTCPACTFKMPAHAIFCPNCGFRVGTPPGAS